MIHLETTPDYVWAGIFTAVTAIAVLTPKVSEVSHLHPFLPTSLSLSLSFSCGNLVMVAKTSIMIHLETATLFWPASSRLSLPSPC